MVDLLRDRGFSEREIAEKASFFNAFSGMEPVPSLAANQTID
jgi:hypothetical protein